MTASGSLLTGANLRALFEAAPPDPVTAPGVPTGGGRTDSHDVAAPGATDPLPTSRVDTVAGILAGRSTEVDQTNDAAALDADFGESRVTPRPKVQRAAGLSRMHDAVLAASADLERGARVLENEPDPAAAASRWPALVRQVRRRHGKGLSAGDLRDRFDRTLAPLAAARAVDVRRAGTLKQVSRQQDGLVRSLAGFAAMTADADNPLRAGFARRAAAEALSDARDTGLLDVGQAARLNDLFAREADRRGADSLALLDPDALEIELDAPEALPGLRQQDREDMRARLPELRAAWQEDRADAEARAETERADAQRVAADAETARLVERLKAGRLTRAEIVRARATGSVTANVADRLQDDLARRAARDAARRAMESRAADAEAGIRPFDPSDPGDVRAAGRWYETRLLPMLEPWLADPAHRLKLPSAILIPTTVPDQDGRVGGIVERPEDRILVEDFGDGQEIADALRRVGGVPGGLLGRIAALWRGGSPEQKLAAAGLSTLIEGLALPVLAGEGGAISADLHPTEGERVRMRLAAAYDAHGLAPENVLAAVDSGTPETSREQPGHPGQNVSQSADPHSVNAEQSDASPDGEFEIQEDDQSTSVTQQAEARSNFLLSGEFPDFEDPAVLAQADALNLDVDKAIILRRAMEATPETLDGILTDNGGIAAQTSDALFAAGVARVAIANSKRPVGDPSRRTEAANLSGLAIRTLNQFEMAATEGGGAVGLGGNTVLGAATVGASRGRRRRRAVDDPAKFASQEQLAAYKRRKADGLPLGFADLAEVATVDRGIREPLANKGFANARVYVIGSSVTGRKFQRESGRFSGPGFSDGSTRGISDIDIAIVHPGLLDAAKLNGIGTRQGGTRSRSMTARELLKRFGVQLPEKTGNGHPITYMIYESAAIVESRAPHISLTE